MKKILAIVLALVMCVGLLVGCGSKDEGNTIKVAFIGNTTGDYAQYGVPVRNAVMLYIDQLNAKGGINGKQVEILEYDDKGDGLEAVNAFKQANDKGITAVIGSVLTGPTISLADETFSVNMPQITASATAAGVTVMEDGSVRTNVFRACFIDPFQGEKMADYAVNKMGAKTAAVLYESGNDYSEGVKDAFEAKAKELGLKVVASEAFATGDKDYNAQMTKIANANPDVVFMPIYYGEAGTAITQGRQAGMKSIVLGGDGFGGIKDYATAADLAGTVYCSGYAPGTPSVAQFEKDYCETFKVDVVPNMFAPLAYDATMLMCKALEVAESKGLKAGSDEYKQAVVDALAGMNGVEGITGSYSFNETNDPIKTAAMIKVENGEEKFSELY